jgi:hypothetical protein
MSQLFRDRGWCFGIGGVVLVSLGLSMKIDEFIKIPNEIGSFFAGLKAAVIERQCIKTEQSCRNRGDA